MLLPSEDFALLATTAREPDSSTAFHEPSVPLAQIWLYFTPDAEGVMSCCTRHHRDGPGITALN